MYAERPPSADLTDRVACGWLRISGVAYTQLVVPDACVDLIWGPQGLFAAGPDTGPMPSTVGEGDALVGVRFRPGAAGDFFGLPLQELRDRRVPLTDLPSLRPLMADLMDRQFIECERTNRSEPSALTSPSHQGHQGRWDRQDQPGRWEHQDRQNLRTQRNRSEHPNHRTHSKPTNRLEVRRGAAHSVPPMAAVEERLRALQRAVRRHLATSSSAPADPVAPAIAAALGQGRSVAEVAWDLGYSERHLQRRSLLSFGYTPKTLQRIVRFQHALRLARAGRPLAEVAIRAGYTDQAHLANDVKRLSGVQMSRLISPVRARQPA